MSLKFAIEDVVKGAQNHEFWMTFGLNDIRSKYRRSKMGEWWITLSVALFIFVIGGLYRGIFSADSGSYLAYLAIGYILWLFISNTITTGCSCLVGARPFMLQRNWPVSSFVYRLIYREILVIAHHAVIIPPIMIWLKLWPGFLGIFLALIGFAICVFTAFWVALFLGIVTLRYRDIPPLVQSLMRLAFFATPIIWFNRNLGEFGTIIYNINPFRYFIEVVRSPLLGEVVPLHDWFITIAWALGACVIAIATLSVTKTRINYWL